MGLLDSGNIDLNDPDMLKQLQALAAQMGPSEDDKKQALKHSLMSASLGLLANNNLPTAMGIGRAGLAGVGSYNDEIKQLGAQRSTNLSQAASALNTMKQAAISQYAMQMLNGTGGAPQPSPGQNAAGGMGAAMSAVGSPSAGIYDAMAQGAPQGQSQGGTQGGMPSRDAMAKMSLAFGLMKGDPTSAAKFMYPDAIAARPGAPIVNPIDGSVMNANAAPPPGFTYDPGSNSYKPVGGNEAFANMAGAKAGATTAATEQAQFPYRMGEKTNPDNTKTSGFVSSLYGGPPALQPSQQNRPQAFNNTQGASPAQLAWMNNDIAQNGYSPAGAPAAPQPTSTSANPVAQAAAIEEATQNAKNLAKYQDAVHTGASGADTQDARIAEMRNMMPKFTPGATLPGRSTAASYALDVPVVGNTVANWLVPNAKEALPAIQAFTKVGTSMVADMSKQMGSREAAQVVDMLRQAFPNVGQVDGAPQKMMDFMQGLNQYSKATEAALSSWKEAHGGSAAGFQEAWRQTNPVSGYIPPVTDLTKIISKQPLSSPSPQVEVPPAAAAHLKANPALRSAFDAKYGAGASDSVLGK